MARAKATAEVGNKKLTPSSVRTQVSLGRSIPRERSGSTENLKVNYHQRVIWLLAKADKSRVRSKHKIL